MAELYDVTYEEWEKFIEIQKEKLNVDIFAQIHAILKSDHGITFWKFIHDYNVIVFETEKDLLLWKIRYK